MFLDKLVITSSNGIVREVPFKLGLNLVLDETTDDPKDSGNNIGKTTFLKVIDYCLGGNKANLYKDKEFKRENKNLTKILKEERYEFHLTLRDRSNKSYMITRTFNGKSSINEKQLSKVDFIEELKRILFGDISSRPTYGELMNKFVRIEDNQVNNTLYFLHQTADHAVYESIFLFLFGFKQNQLFQNKRKYIDECKLIEKSIASFEVNVEEIEQQINLIETNISKLNDLKAQFQFASSAEEELTRLQNLQEKISNLKLEISRINLKISVNSESFRQLKESVANIDSSVIQTIYAQATVELPNLNKKFDEVVEFYNGMIHSKSAFIKKTIDALEREVLPLQNEMKSLLEEESKILRSINETLSLGEYDSLNVKLQELFRDKGNREGQIQTLTKLSSRMAEINDSLKAVNSTIQLFLEEFKENIKEFNLIFSDYSNRLYGEQYYISPKISKNSFTTHIVLDIGNLFENVGTGKKKTQISSFDLAYLKYVADKKIQMPFFVLHDQIEVIHENQIRTLFEIANSIDGQYIVAVLRDKLRKIDSSIIKENEILRLSQGDKLFRIETVS